MDLTWVTATANPSFVFSETTPQVSLIFDVAVGNFSLVFSAIKSHPCMVFSPTTANFSLVFSVIPFVFSLKLLPAFWRPSLVLSNPCDALPPSQVPA
jgi:hypothetical protein